MTREGISCFPLFGHGVGREQLQSPSLDPLREYTLYFWRLVAKWNGERERDPTSMGRALGTCVSSQGRMYLLLCFEATAAT